MNSDELLKRIFEFNDTSNKFEYGLFIDGKRKKNSTSEDWDKNFKLASPDQFEKRGGGVCWDWVSYEANHFRKNFPEVRFTTWYIGFDNGKSCPTHTFLTFELEGKTYYFESSFYKYKGIYTGEIKDILNFVMTNMNNNPPEGESDLVNHPYTITKYNALNSKIYGYNCGQFMSYCSNSQRVLHKYNPNFKTPTKIH